MVESLGFGPLDYFEQNWGRFAWIDFYSKLMKRDRKSFDLVINAADSLINLSNNNDNGIGELVLEDRKKEVSRLKVREHLGDYLRQRCYNLAFEDVNSANKFYWNALHDIKRCLKRIRDDEAPFQLPYQDIRLTLDFLERLKRPPLKKSYPTGYL